MRRIETAIPGVCLIEPRVFCDPRGWFMETYSAGAFADMGIYSTFVQDNRSFSAHKGTLRGIHFQNAPMAQAKLVRVARGAVRDIAVDLRKGSPSYLRWVAAELSADNRRMLFIPRGFGHGFVTLTDGVEFCYKADNPYSPEHERAVRHDDPALGVDWGLAAAGIIPLLSERDANAPLLAESGCNFVFGARELA
ncbi:MAG: dTDP-4-dehydrorhamnose 3,5-epimerase [Mailhella sp.]|nr:dTDP-4-dehydrorhamnose 3,5-epimerase [Mailhella sp.]